MAELLLHIGTKKTGTTFLQRYLGANAEQLKEQGITHPSLPGAIRNVNHLEIALPFEQRNSVEHQQRSMLDEATRQAAIQRWRDTLSSAVGPDETWVMTSEHFSSRLQSPEEVQATASFLREFFDSIKVVVFLRRQEFMFASAFSQSIKDGHNPMWSWEYCEERLPHFNYQTMLARWGDAVDVVAARPYLERYRHENDAFMEQFSAASGISFTDDWDDPPEATPNRSLSAEGIAFMRLLNPQVPRLRPDKSSNKALRAEVINKVMELTPGSSFSPDRDILDRITEYYAPANLAVVAGQPADPLWDEWLDQQQYIPDSGVPIPRLKGPRRRALLEGVVAPNGPLDWDKSKVNDIYRRSTAPVVAARRLRARVGGDR